jgi:hypothetical protein
MSETYEEQLRAYHRDMVLACLQRAEGKQSAGELSEFATALAMSEGHPKACWAPLSPQAVQGILRQLQRQGLVDNAEGRRNTRYGRDEPMWVPAAGTFAVQVPLHPEIENTPARAAAAAAAAVGAVTLGAPSAGAAVCMESLSREQLLTILQLSDEVGVRVETFVRDMQDLANRARRALAAREDGRG